MASFLNSYIRPSLLDGILLSITVQRTTAGVTVTIKMPVE